MQAGFAQVPITPPIGTPMAGYFHIRISDGILDDLYAHALVLEEGGSRIALVSCDLIEVPRAVVHQARELLAEELPPESILIAATHTHTGPCLVESYYSGSPDPDWLALLPRLIAGSVRAAIRRLEPVEIAFGTGRAPEVVFNRRFRMQDGSIRTNPGIGNPAIVGPVGPTDPEVGVLAVRSTERDQLLGVLVNFACHLDTTGGTRFSADYPAYLSRSLRRLWGEELGFLFFLGPCGDVNHIDVTGRLKGARLSHPERIGLTLAGEVLRVIANRTEYTPTAPLVAAWEEIVLPYRLVSEEELSWARALLESSQAPGPSVVKPDLLHARKLLRVAEAQEPGRTTEIQALRIGEAAIVGVPGEPFVELGLAIKESSPGRPTLVIELANDSTGYLGTEQAYAEGGYEVSASPYAPHAGGILVQKAIALTQRIFS